jgi:hypothetical protein
MIVVIEKGRLQLREEDSVFLDLHATPQVGPSNWILPALLIEQSPRGHAEAQFSVMDMTTLGSLRNSHPRI